MNYLDGLTDDMPDEFFRLAQVFELNLFEPVRIGGKTKALGYSWSSSSTPDWNTGNVVEINTFGKDGLDLRRFDYGVAIGLSVEYRHYVIGVEGRLGLCKLQKELQGKNITGFVTAGYKF